MRTAAILPVKRFREAKQRLRASLSDPLREQLAAAMLGDVLAALARTEAIELTVLVTDERSAALAAREHGALVLPDTAGAGQSAAVGIGVHRALAEGLERVLCVPGDCPALDAAELGRLLAGPPAGEGEVVVMPDRHGTGTNGLLLSPPTAIEPSFGPDSCARHLALARAAGVPARVQRLGSLLLDVDTGADLAALRERLAAHPGAAERTRALLHETLRAPAGAPS